MYCFANKTAQELIAEIPQHYTSNTVHVASIIYRQINRVLRGVTLHHWVEIY
jgi:hypothetical protein